MGRRWLAPILSTKIMTDVSTINFQALWPVGLAWNGTSPPLE
jgi:hypothetical protein